jgi:hypothetical protein
VPTPTFTVSIESRAAPETVDETGKFSHRCTFTRIAEGTRVTRAVQFDLSVAQYGFYLVTLKRVRLSAVRAALAKLKQQLEK